jgi:hypothetical protein
MCDWCVQCVVRKTMNAYNLISRFMVERLQGEVTKLQSDNLKLRRKLKDSGVDLSEG